jgi:hypothetical protein
MPRWLQFGKIRFAFIQYSQEGAILQRETLIHVLHSASSWWCFVKIIQRVIVFSGDPLHVQTDPSPLKK